VLGDVALVLLFAQNVTSAVGVRMHIEVMDVLSAEYHAVQEGVRIVRMSDFKDEFH
jgi:hypothetical protein